MKNQAAEKQYEGIRALMSEAQWDCALLEMDTKLALLKHTLMYETKELGVNQFIGLTFVVDDIRNHCKKIQEIMFAIDAMNGLYNASTVKTA